MPEQAEKTEQADDSDDTQRTGPDGHQERQRTDTRAQPGSSQSDRCKFDDFAMI